MQDELSLIKKLPFSLIAEQSLLGSILIDPECFNNIADKVNSGDFYMEEHTQIFLAMHELYLANSDIDVVTLIDMLVKKGIYDKSGGENYIKLISEATPSAHNAADYARIVKEKSILRQLIEAGDDISNVAYAGQDEVSHIIDYAENKIFSIAQGRETKNFMHIRELFMSVYDRLHKLQTDRASVQATATGFSGLDAILAGMEKSDLVLIGSRPGMGKTSFVLNIAINVAKATKKKVCVFQLEMSGEQLALRLLSSEAMVDSHALRTGELAPADWEKIAQAASELSECDILIDDTTNITITGMKAKLRRVDNLGLVVIDYLQLMQSDRKIDNRVQEVADISRNLKVMAKELGVPVICCAQLSRGPESRTVKKPMLSDLRDSGAIEQDADVVMFLYRDEYYKPEEAAQQDSSIAEVIIAKNRHGSTGVVKMGWVGKYTKFRTIANVE